MKILPPTDCPTCGSKLERVKDQLFCRNSSCAAQCGKKVEKFLKVFGVKGFGAAIVAKFNFDSLLDAIVTLSSIEEEKLSSIVGSTAIGKKLHSQLGFLSESVDPATLIEAVSIASIGAVSAKKLAPYFPDNVDSAPIGDVAKSHVKEWLIDNQDLLSVLTIATTDNSQLSKELIPVYISGKLSRGLTKSAASEILEKHGYKLEPAMTKKVKILICDGAQTSIACEKARKAGIPIITFNTICTEE